MILDPVPPRGHSQPVASGTRKVSGRARGPSSRAHQHRVHVGPVLVDQVQPTERVGQIGAAERQVAAGLGLEPTDLVRVDLGGDRGVPVRPVNDAGVEDLTRRQWGWR
jgi:hypothetical protein